MNENSLAGLRSDDVSVVLINGQKTVIGEGRLAAIQHGYIVLDSDPVLLAEAGVMNDDEFPVFEVLVSPDVPVDLVPVDVPDSEPVWELILDGDEQLSSPDLVETDRPIVEMFRLKPPAETRPEVSLPVEHETETIQATPVENESTITNSAEDEGEPALRQLTPWGVEPPAEAAVAWAPEAPEAPEVSEVPEALQVLERVETQGELLAAKPVIPPVLRDESFETIESDAAFFWPVIEAAPETIEPEVFEVDDDIESAIVWPVIFDNSDIDPPSWAVIEEAPQIDAQVFAFPSISVSTVPTAEEIFDTAFGPVSVLVPAQQPVPAQQLVPAQQPVPAQQLDPAPRTTVAPNVGENISSESVPTISVDGLIRNINGPNGRIAVLAGVTLDLAPGDLYIVSGPSGAGTTTLVNCLAGLDDVDGGRISINGEEMKEWSDNDRARFRAAAAGIVSQDLDLIDDLSALENTTLPLLAAGWSGPAASSEAQRLLAMFGLAERSNHLPSQLSRGERQRVAVARALVGDPLVVWADDPTSCLDSIQGQLVVDALIGHHRRGATVFVASRDQRFVVPGSRSGTLENGVLTSRTAETTDLQTAYQATDLRSDPSPDLSQASSPID